MYRRSEKAAVEPKLFFLSVRTPSVATLLVDYQKLAWQAARDLLWPARHSVNATYICCNKFRNPEFLLSASGPTENIHPTTTERVVSRVCSARSFRYSGEKRLLYPQPPQSH